MQLSIKYFRDPKYSTEHWVSQWIVGQKLLIISRYNHGSIKQAWLAHCLHSTTSLDWGTLGGGNSSVINVQLKKKSLNSHNYVLFVNYLFRTFRTQDFFTLGLQQTWYRMACVIHTSLAIDNTQRAAAHFALPGKSRLQSKLQTKTACLKHSTCLNILILKQREKWRQWAVPRSIWGIIPDRNTIILVSIFAKIPQSAADCRKVSF